MSLKFRKDEETASQIAQKFKLGEERLLRTMIKTRFQPLEHERKLLEVERDMLNEPIRDTLEYIDYRDTIDLSKPMPIDLRELAEQSRA